MNFLSHPPGYEPLNQKEFTEFDGFRVYITKRSWLGKTFIGKEHGESFLRELQDTIELIQSSLDINTLPFTIDLSFIIDSSVFKGKDEFSPILLDFLEELEDFEEKDGCKKKVRTRYWKKLKIYAEKPEAYPYLYRWCINHPSHSFANELKEIIHQNINVRINKMINTMRKKHAAIETKSLSTNKKLEEFKLVASKELRDSITPLYKYVWSEAGLFYIAVWFTNVFLQLFHDLRIRKTKSDGEEKNFCYVIPISRSGYKNEFSISPYSSKPNEKISGAILEYFLECETHIHEVNKRENKQLGVGTIKKDINNGMEEDPQEVNVLKEIAKWATNRVKEYEASEKVTSWTHVVTSNMFLNLGIEEIKFEEARIIQGPNGEELSILASAYLSTADSNGMSNQRVIFPIFEADHWGEIGAFQSVLHAYAICLYHDFLSSSDYTLIPRDKNSKLEAPYQLVFNKQANGILSTLNKQTTSASQAMSKQDKERVMKEHWVSFHFRKLPQGYKASEEAQRTARKYGFTSIPQGYTFVDIFVKGGEGQNISSARISALDVLSKTLNKTQHLKENINDVR